uniref:Major facilitator superfamily (MFS) profile domain-containing protein n=1 Tax=Meloidogyne javanica TaxID=6303 RepID=A0A915MUI8_MELJA
MNTRILLTVVPLSVILSLASRICLLLMVISENPSRFMEFAVYYPAFFANFFINSLPITIGLEKLISTLFCKYYEKNKRLRFVGIGILAIQESRTLFFNVNYSDKHFGPLEEFLALFPQTLALLGTLFGHLICMEEDNTESVTSLPKIQKKREPLKEHLNSEDTKWQKDWLLSVVAVGTLLGTLPITWITEKLGIRWMVTVYGMLSSLATLLVPFASTLGFWTLLAVRVVQGFGVATSYVAMSTISEEWAPLSESGMFLCLISCHFQFGPLLVMPIAGELCESTFGWTAVYHIFGSVSIFFFILFCLFFRDSPNEHFLTTELERRLIGDGKKQIFEADKNSGNVPYLRMLTDIVVWGILISNLGATFGNQIFNQLGPQYLSKALGMHPKNAGFAAALPFLLAAAIKIMAGPISDKIAKNCDQTLIIHETSEMYYINWK